jgi:hypothetical protein
MNMGSIDLLSLPIEIVDVVASEIQLSDRGTVRSSCTSLRDAMDRSMVVAEITIPFWDTNEIRDSRIGVWEKVFSRNIACTTLRFKGDSSTDVIRFLTPVQRARIRFVEASVVASKFDLGGMTSLEELVLTNCFADRHISLCDFTPQTERIDWLVELVETVLHLIPLKRLTIARTPLTCSSILRIARALARISTLEVTVFEDVEISDTRNVIISEVLR